MWKFAILCLSFILISKTGNCDTLKSLFITNRHGNRNFSKIAFYMNSFNLSINLHQSLLGSPNFKSIRYRIYGNETYWSMGPKQLTNIGKQKMFDIGLHLRKRYDEFLGNNILEVYARSSDTDR